MAITDMHRMPAHLWDITGQDISTTASSWAWVLGPAGVITTAGAAIASVAMVADAITAEPAALPTVDVPAAVGEVDMADKRVAEAETA